MILKKSSVEIEYYNLYDLSAKTIYMPVFQRGYSWKEKFVVDIKNELISLTDSTADELYLMDFIWYSEDDKFKLADGQQRIVTINILIKAINDYIHENSLAITPITPFNIIYEDSDFNDRYIEFYTGTKLKGNFKKVYIDMQKLVTQLNSKLERLIDRNCQYRISH